jgi:hypothetical protein
LEIRIGGGGKGAQTIFPGSTHKETGEPITWENDELVATIDGAELKRRCSLLAACALLARHYPTAGGRHDGALIIGGFLARCGLDDSDIKIFVDALATASGQPKEKRLDMIRAARDAASSQKDGAHVYGYPKLAEVFGEAVAKKCGEWLGYKGTERATGQPACGSDPGNISLDDFFAYMPTHSYIFVPSRDMWPAASVNSRIPPIPSAVGKPITATSWLDCNKPVDQMTWAPGAPMIIKNRLIAEGGWIERAGSDCFNLYRPPAINLGDANKAAPWVAHVQAVYPDEATHIINYAAHR